MKIVRKRIKNLYIRVEEDGTVVVSAPVYTPYGVIENLIERNREKLESIVKKKRESLIDCSRAEAIPFLGGFVDIVKVKSDRDYFEFKGDKLYLYLKDTEGERIRGLVFQWYLFEIKRVIENFISKYSSLIPKGIERVRVREMKTRWGSCNSAKGYLNFNVKLAQKPLKGIEYVVVHELTHLIHPDHGKGFYKTLESLMPDWREGKESLK